MNKWEQDINKDVQEDIFKILKTDPKAIIPYFKLFFEKIGKSSKSDEKFCEQLLLCVNRKTLMNLSGAVHRKHLTRHKLIDFRKILDNVFHQLYKLC